MPEGCNDEKNSHNRERHRSGDRRSEEKIRLPLGEGPLAEAGGTLEDSRSVRCDDRAQSDEGDRRAAEGRLPLSGGRTGRRGHRQRGCSCRHGTGDRGGLYPGRKRDLRRRAGPGHDALPRQTVRRGRCKRQVRQMGPDGLYGRRALR